MTDEESTEKKSGETKKRMTQPIKERCIHLKNNGLNIKAIAETVDFSEAAVSGALLVGKS